MNWSTILKGTSTTKKNSNVDSLIDWNSVLHTLLSRGTQILITTGIFFLIWRIGKRLLTRYLLKNPKFQEHMTGRKRTLAQLGVALFQYTILLKDYFFLRQTFLYYFLYNKYIPAVYFLINLLFYKNYLIYQSYWFFYNF